MKNLIITLSFAFILSCGSHISQKKHSNIQKHTKPDIIAYFFSKTKSINDLPLDKLSHIIYSFANIVDNKIVIPSRKSQNQIKKLVLAKQNNPNLKVMIAVGGWSWSENFSDMALTEKNRTIFIDSAKEIIDKYNLDGIDIDWEYPAMMGEKGNIYRTEDTQNLTLLLSQLREKLGQKKQISIAVGGFKKALSLIEWQKIQKNIDRINLMSYDLYNGGSRKIGHHTPLYPNKNQSVSVDNGVKYLLKKGVKPNKIVIGAAFYGRGWSGVDFEKKTNQKPLKENLSYKNIKKNFENNSNFTQNWDEKSKAPFIENKKQKIFVSYDNPKSVSEKSKYVIDNNLGGIMFWSIESDSEKYELLNSIFKTINN